jgi:signal transduction histidine kinase/ActR/RegA family two-component response regulator
VALLVIVLLTTHDTASGQGPFAAEHLSLGERLIALQIYIGVMAVSFHGLALLWEERSRAAAALRLAHAGLEARFKPIVEQSPFAIAAIDAVGRVRELNPTTWRRLWGAADGARADGQELRPWRGGRLDPFVKRAFAGEIVELPTHTIETPSQNGAELRHVRGTAYPVKDERDRVFEIVIIERDITEDLAAERQLVEANESLREREEALSRVLAQMADAQAQREELLEAERVARGEAEYASQLKDEFLATLSHELRTPLNAIVGWAHILRRDANEKTLAQAVDTIERNARAQAKLIDDLLDMSRIMAGKMGLALAHVVLSEVVVAVAEALRPAAEAKGITVALGIAAAERACVSADPTRLQQVVSNLLGNSIKFTPGGGRIDAVLETRGQEIRLIVRDTGLGIAPEFLPAVFERFRQADGTITRHHGGLGLGLNIAKHIVEMHGGTISAESAGPERGATFTVTLPLAAESEADDPVAQDGDQLVSLAGLRVLVVDDEADARELLHRLLAEHDCEVTLASSAAEALAMLAQGPCDVLLTDIGMPGIDGYDLMRRVRAGRYGQPRAIAVTAFARAEDRDRAIAAGFDAHLAKPVNAARLLQTVAQLAAASRIDKPL